MVRPEKRRAADPSTTMLLWASIKYIRHQRQIPNLDRVSRYMQREHTTKPSDTDLQLKLACEDELVIAYTTVGFKGSKIGTEQEGFKLPEINDEFERDGHDWYCFDCHQPGEVLCCSDCWRVYHPTCTEEEWTGDSFVCTVCKNIKKQPRMKRKELNRLLSYTILRLKDKTKGLYSFGAVEGDDLKVERFIYKYIDLNIMEEKTKERKYKYLEQFFADARTLLHNTFICYGEYGEMVNLAKIMIRDCKYDLDEIRQCKDCYHYSNAKPKDWFCQPCRPPHELVYAKQKGFCFWPAKVIKVTQEGYDVRFFGGWHQRAILPATSIKDIDASMKSLAVKRTSGFNKAVSELKRHQELVKRMSEEGGGVGAGENSELEGDEEEEMEEPEIKHKKFRHSAKKSDRDEKTPLRKSRDHSESTPIRKSRDLGETTSLKRDHDDSYRRSRHGNDDDGGPVTSKKARQEEVISSTMSQKASPTPEDVNMVTSSEDNIQTPRTFSTSDIGVQTSKKLTHPGKQPHKSTQTDAENPSSVKCNCEEKYHKYFNDYKERIEDEKDKALKDLESRLQREFEEERKQTLTRTNTNTQRELELVRQQTEERCKEVYLEELKKLQKHKAEISTTKKKQWCYNCEEEAMYHCCWNTSYCSIKCQQEHWHREHKRMCRRKRN